MIKIDKNECCFEGVLTTIATDVVVTLKCFKELCVGKLGEEAGNEFYSNVTDVAGMNSTEFKQEKERLEKEVRRRIIGLGE